MSRSAAGQKTPPVNADEVCLRNSADKKNIVWTTLTNFLAYLKAYFDTLYLPSCTTGAFWDWAIPAGNWKGWSSIALPDSATEGKWLFCAGGTIGDASSGGTVRANADTSSLFTFLWTNGNDTTLPIQTSAGGASTRGASAAADFAAQKRMSLPNWKDKGPMGYDESGTFNAMFATGGEETHLLTGLESGVNAHFHSIAMYGIGVVDIPHHHDVQYTQGCDGAKSALIGSAGGTNNCSSANATNAHNNLQPYFVTNFVIKY